MPCNYRASKSTLQAFLAPIAFLHQLTAAQLNSLYDSLVWTTEPAHADEEEEAKNKKNLLAWIGRNEPRMKDPNTCFKATQLIRDSMKLRTGNVQSAAVKEEVVATSGGPELAKTTAVITDPVDQHINSNEQPVDGCMDYQISSTEPSAAGSCMPDPESRTPSPVASSFSSPGTVSPNCDIPASSVGFHTPAPVARMAPATSPSALPVKQGGRRHDRARKQKKSIKEDKEDIPGPAVDEKDESWSAAANRDKFLLMELCRIMTDSFEEKVAKSIRQGDIAQAISGSDEITGLLELAARTMQSHGEAEEEEENGGSLFVGEDEEL